MLKSRIFVMFLAVLALMVGFGSQAEAHRKAESYVFFSVTDDTLTGRIEATLKDVNRMIPLDTNQDGKISEAEFTAKQDAVFNFFAERLSVSSNGEAFALASTGFGFFKVPFGTFAQLNFEVAGLSPTPEAVEVTYEPLTDAANPGHLGYGIIENNTRTGVENNEAYISLIFDVGGSTRTLSLVGDPWTKVFVDFVIHGIWHILKGFDHVLFLVTLLLPAVLFRNNNAWAPEEDFSSALWTVIKIATVFTLSHSVTLSLAALGIVTLPVSFVEAVIALSIAVVALMNMFPRFHQHTLWIVFIFGLFHGFGFANVLEPLGVQPASKVVGLAAFNIGVELGQIAIILVLFPVLFLIRRWQAYPFLALRLASVAIIAISGLWLVERTSGVFWRMQQDLLAFVG
ncbi:MAG: HupE/UreJ family protein [Pseudomonadota bacterium]